MTGGTRVQRQRGGNGWPPVPPEAAEQIRLALPTLLDEMIEEIHATVAEYARPDNSDYALAVRRGVEQGVHGFIERIANPKAARDRMVEVFGAIGQNEAAEGRSLEALQSALRAGARVAMRRLADRSQRDSAPFQTFGVLAEAVLVHLDELASVSAEGYEKARTWVAGELERRRRRLVSLLLAEPPAAEGAIRELARLARWRLPSTVTVIVLTMPEDDAGESPPLADDVLKDLDRAQPWLIVPDPTGPGRREMLDRALRGIPAAAGPAVPLRDARTSLRWAQEALILLQRGAPAPTSVLHCDDHLVELLLLRNEDLIGRLTDRRLAPLAGLSAATRQVLAETLLAWLQLGRTGDVASRLFVHPQTVRYRLRKLRGLFGAQLHDPDARFELELALRANRHA